MVGAEHEPWWKGARGEWLVVVQVLLIALVFFGPRRVGDTPTWSFPFAHACPFVGGVLMIGGSVLLVAGGVGLGRGLTPLPYPKVTSKLVQIGPFALVRHPMYGGGLLLAMGWALCVQGWLTLGYVITLFVFLDMKSRREELWLRRRSVPTPADRPGRRAANRPQSVLLYLGVYTTLAASVFYTLNPIVVAVAAFVVVVHHRIVLAEERYLTNAFGSSYTDYCRRVRRYL